MGQLNTAVVYLRELRTEVFAFTDVYRKEAVALAELSVELATTEGRLHGPIHGCLLRALGRVPIDRPQCARTHSTCFGVDDRIKEMREWFRTLDADEQERRREFARKFKADYDAFRALPLGTARHISEHRTGVPP